MIDKVYISKYFENIKEQNVFSVKDELNWGFYFSHNKIELLKSAINHTIFTLYDFKEIVCCDNLYYLQIAKNEFHTEDTLLNRCNELYEFSKKLGIDSFDGFDVEPL